MMTLCKHIPEVLLPRNMLDFCLSARILLSVVTWQYVHENLQSVIIVRFASSPQCFALSGTESGHTGLGQP